MRIQVKIYLPGNFFFQPIVGTFNVEYESTKKKIAPDALGLEVTDV